MARVLLKGVTKTFGTTIAVNHVDLEVPDKRFVVLLGPSGCGKTTILRLVAGLEELSSGEIHIDNRQVNHVPAKDRNIAMVFQSYALYPHMNVYQNMAIGLRLRKFNKREIDERVRSAAEMLGLRGLLDRKPAALSGGERQRVAMGRAIVRKPDVFLFDEPLSNLDAKLRVRMRAEIKQLHGRLETTVIYVTHDQVEAMTLADEIVVMNKGNLMQRGTPLEVFRKPQNLFVAGFLGAPAMNLLNVRLVKMDGGFRIRGEGIDLVLPDKELSILTDWENRELILGARPEHMHPLVEKELQQKNRQIEGRVEFCEPLGSETVIHFRVGGQEVLAICDPEETPAVNQSIGFSIDMGKIHLFDPTSGSALC